MRRLSLSVDVKAPSDFALAFLTTYFMERAPHTSGSQIALRFPVPPFIVEGLTLEKRVRVHLAYTPDAGAGHRLTIAWQPLGKGPLPSFDGILRTSESSATTSRVWIEGAYAPPGGIAGAMFDELLGVRIARATIGALLAQWQVAIEDDYRARSYP